ncbi:MAG: chemotaxis protein CheW [SAR324 cluster bacterium]|nr:chemotaxis protein CheW [SAR324 cluster bacterium]
MKLDPRSDISQFVTFMVNQEIFGVLIHAVEEIITLPDKITPVPRAPYYFSGMINLRGEVISVIDLRNRFHMPAAVPTNMTRILIVSVNGVKVGMIVDAVTRVLPINSKDVRPPPAIVSRSESSYIFGSVRQNEGVLLLIDTDLLIDPAELVLHNHIPKDDKKTNLAHPLQVSKTYRERILIGFRLNQDYYALDINYVEEIIEMPKITLVPEMADKIEGIFYQRDQALPILRLGRRFLLPDIAYTEDTSVLIVNDDRLMMGLIVDQITEVFHVLENDIVPPPPNISGRSAEQLDGIIKIKRNDHTEVIMALNLPSLLTEDEQAHLQQLRDELNDIEDETSEEETHSEIISILKFKVGEETFAVRVLEINEITTIQKMVRVPKAPPFVKGVINLRGDVITIIEMATFFGNQPLPVSEKTRIIIIEVNDQKAGFQVDQILGIDHVPYHLFEKPVGINRQYNEFVEGIGRTSEKGEIVILIDTPETLSQAEFYDGDIEPALLESP